MQDYHLNPKESEIRKGLSKQMEALSKSNHHACTTILKQKISSSSGRTTAGKVEKLE
jgi:hypothetical protein